jgi:hypothetical protein
VNLVDALRSEVTSQGLAFLQDLILRCSGKGFFNHLATEFWRGVGVCLGALFSKDLPSQMALLIGVWAKHFTRKRGKLGSSLPSPHSHESFQSISQKLAVWKD